MKGKLAPRQGEKGGYIADIPGHVSACELIDLFASCLDLRGLCADPCVLPQRDDALTAIVERGVSLRRALRRIGRRAVAA